MGMHDFFFFFLKYCTQMVHEPAWTYALNTEINTFNEGKN